ncbi:MAG: TonB family protein [Janthinobacterium lividum]
MKPPLLVLLSFLALPALGQATPGDSTRAGARVEVKYVDAKGKKLPSAEGADHRIETSYIDSVKASVRVFYPSGKLMSYTPYVNIKRRFVHGRFLEYYESGQLHLQGDFIANKRQGDFLVYYPDGQLRRRDHYEAGQRTAGECFGPDGHAIEYFEYEQKPIYLEGDGSIMAIIKGIQQRVRYPKSALRHRLAGTIKVKFTVNKAGEVQDASIVGGVDESKFEGPTLEAVRDMELAVLQAVRDLKRFQPARLDGVSVDFNYTAPISFKIQ